MLTVAKHLGLGSGLGMTWGEKVLKMILMTGVYLKEMWGAHKQLLTQITL